MTSIVLKKAKTDDFDLIYSEMEKNFIPDEIRNRTDALEVFSDSLYTVYHAEMDGERVGFITVWELSEFAFAEHFVTYEGFRNKGYGKSALLALGEIYKNIVLEVEHPNTDMQRRRLAFYKRCGFSENPEPYMQPSYNKDSREVPLIIMSYPKRLENFEKTVREIKTIVYKK